MDFDNFEFKPLTEGLGFRNQANHTQVSNSEASRPDDAKSEKELNFNYAPPKKSTSFSAPAPFTDAPQVKESSSFFDSPQESLSDLIESLPPSLENDSPLASPPPLFSAKPSEPKIFQPLPRDSTAQITGGDFTIQPSRQLNSSLEPNKKAPTTIPTGPATLRSQPTAAPSFSREPLKPAPTFNAPPVAGSPSLHESLKKAFPQREIAKVDTDARHDKKVAPSAIASPDASKYRELAASPAAVFIDGVVISGLTLLCTVIIVFAFDLDVFRLLVDPRTSQSAALQLGVLFLGLVHIYVLLSRSLLGATLGDWAFDVQVGTSQEQQRLRYPLQVLWRSVLMMLTGFVLIPLLSLLFKKDLAAPLTGLRLLRKQF